MQTLDMKTGPSTGYRIPAVIYRALDGSTTTFATASTPDGGMTFLPLESAVSQNQADNSEL